jgi:hypothetical protein
MPRRLRAGRLLIAADPCRYRPGVEARCASRWPSLYKKSDSDAGDDCRDRLDAVNAVVKSWVTKTPIHGKQND